VDQIQRDFETKIKNKHENILKINKKIDIKTKKNNKYLVLKEYLIRKKKEKFSRIRKMRQNCRYNVF
jgi:uncharacterized protein YydD (DUF2326 family)